MLALSPQNPKVKLVRALLNSASARKQHQLFVIENVNVISEIVKKTPNLIRYLIYSSPNSPFESIESHRIKTLSGLSSFKAPQDVLAVVRRPTWNVRPEKAVLVDRLANPANFGAIIRNAAAFKMDAVYYTPGTVDPFHPESVRAAAGSCVQIPILECNDFQTLGLTPYVMTPHSAQLLSTTQFAKNPLFMFGSEAHGLDSSYSKYNSIKIDIAPEIESLNVAVSSGIVLYVFNNPCGGYN